MGAAGWFASRKRGLCAPAAGLVRRHPTWALAGVLAVGLMLRAAFFWGYLHGDAGAFQPGDGQVFFAEAQDMASGHFPDTKSWVTVGGYALSMRLFGMTHVQPCVLNALLQTVCAALLWALGRRLFGSVAATLAALAYFWSPWFVTTTFQLYSEHFFFPLVLAEFLLMGRWLARRSVLCAGAGAAVALLALWTKPDAGILSLAAMGFVFAADALLWKASRKRVLAGVAVALAVLLCGLSGARWVNRTWHGTSTCLCSLDGIWPHYFGANRETGGRARMEDKRAVYEAYRRETGTELEFRQNHCPPELVSRIREEIRCRWAAMTAAEKIRHVLAKEAYTWQAIGNPRYRTKLIPNLHAAFKVAVWLAACWTLLRLSRRALAVPRVEPADLIRALPVLYLLGMFCCVALVEANFRYSVCANVFLPLYFGALAGWRPRAEEG